MYNKKFAFTLAEVIITIGIIGIIAEITIPNLVSDYQKQVTVNKLKKTYSEISQAIKLSEIDNSNFSTWEAPTTGDSESNLKHFETYWAPYLKILKYCKTTSDCDYPDNVFYRKNKTKHHFADTDAQVTTVLSDGTCLIVRFGHRDNNKSFIKDYTIFIDINGAKKPNTYGNDVFIILINDNGFVRPAGYTLSTDKINNECVNIEGRYCFAKIVNDGWQIKDDYGW